MTEREYRIFRLMQNRKNIGQRIVLYGTGKNAEYIIRKCPELPIIGLMDEKRTGRFFWGRKVLSERQVLELKPDVMVMAAEHNATQAIYARMLGFCRRHQITLLNMYGEEEMALHQMILEQEIAYLSQSVESLKAEIVRHEGICFELFGTLCEYNLPAISRRSARPLNIEEVQSVLENAIPRTEMIALFHYARQNNKKVSIYVGLKMSCEDAQKLLARLDIHDYSILLQEGSGNEPGFANGLFRQEAEKYPAKQMLYIGTDHNGSLTIPLTYGQSVFLIKSSREMFRQMTAYSPPPDQWEDVTGQPIFTDIVIREYNNPFCLHGTDGNYHMSPELGRIENYAKLTFTKYDQPLVSIIIPVYNQFTYTYHCLKSILNSGREITYEIILADDCSTDLTKNITQVVKNIRVVRNKEALQFLRNCNHAAGLARGKYLVFLNNDTQVQPGWLKSLAELMEKDEKIGLTGSRLLFPDGRLQEAGGLVFRDGSAANYGCGDCPDLAKYNYIRKVDYISGASIMVRQQLWEEVGGFDERYCPAYYEDTDLAFAIRKQGFEVVYQPESVVVHFRGGSYGTDPTKGVKASQIINREKFRSKWQRELEHYPEK